MYIGYLKNIGVTHKLRGYFTKVRYSNEIVRESITQEERNNFIFIITEWKYLLLFYAFIFHWNALLLNCY